MGEKRPVLLDKTQRKKKKKKNDWVVAVPFNRFLDLLDPGAPSGGGKLMSPPNQPRRPAAANNQVVRAHLARKTLPDFLSELEKEGRRELVTLSPGDSLSEASAALAAAGVLSAPVIDPGRRGEGGGGGGGPGGAGGTFRGFFDVADSLRAVVELARERCPELLLPPPPPPEPSPAAAAAGAPASAAASSSLPLSQLLLAAANDDGRRVGDCAHAAGEAWFRADDGGKTSMLDVVVSGFRATARGARGGSSSAAFLAAAADPLSRPAHRVAVFGIERQDDGGGESGEGATPPAAATTADGPTLSWRVRGVVSQSDVVRYISERSTREFEPALRQSVAELGFAPGVAAAAAAARPPLPAGAGASSSPLVVLPAGTPAVAAFAAMASRRASAVALVDEEDGGGGGGEERGSRGGALLACLTNSDLRGFRGGGEHFAALLRPAAEIAAAVAAEAERRSSSFSPPSSSSSSSSSGGGGIWAPGGPLSTAAAGSSQPRPPPPSGGGTWRELLSAARARLVSVTPGASLGEALRKAAGARVHRVWVVEEGPSGRPVGVVGLGDMLRVLVQEEDE